MIEDDAEINGGVGTAAWALLLLPVVAVRRLLGFAHHHHQLVARPASGGSFPSPVEKKQQGGDELPPVALYYRRSKEEEAADCVLCLSGIEEGSEVRELSCRHLFHRACLDRWLFLGATCPLCRCSLLAAPAPPWEEEHDDQDSDSDMMLFMACLHSRSTWFWPSS